MIALHTEIIILREWGFKYNIYFPEKEKDFLAVEELDLSDKGIEYIPPQLSILSKLRTLIIKNNPIKELPDEFEDLESLEIFDFRNTPLAKNMILPNPSSVYACVRDEATADYVYGNKPANYFKPVYLLGKIDDKLIVIQYKDAYDLIEQRKTLTGLAKAPSVYKVMQEKLSSKIISKFGVKINSSSEESGIYFNPEDEIEIKKFICRSNNPMVSARDSQEMIEKAAGIRQPE